MKTITTPAPASASIFRQSESVHTVRVIKADQAAAFLSPDKAHHTADSATHPKKPSEVRMVGTGPDYCDLEFVCGCGEVTRFRCWNTEEKVAAK